MRTNDKVFVGLKQGFIEMGDDRRLGVDDRNRIQGILKSSEERGYTIPEEDNLLVFFLQTLFVKVPRTTE